MQLITPCVSSAGVVRLLACTKACASSSNPIRTVKVPPMSTATKIKHRLQQVSYSSQARRFGALVLPGKLRLNSATVGFGPPTITAIGEPLNADQFSENHRPIRQGKAVSG